jgi:hypothetical protein
VTEGCTTLQANDAGCKVTILFPLRYMLVVCYVIAQNESGMTLPKFWKTRQPQFLAIWPATIVLFILSPILARGSISGGSILIVFSFASILAIAAVGQTLVIQQGGLDLRFLA